MQGPAPPVPLQPVNRRRVMRHLFQPRVLNLAVIAALVSALAAYPRLSLWLTRTAPAWYLEVMVFLCAIVLWGFVFAWHKPYTGRPVFMPAFERGPFIAATVVALMAALVFGLWLDPALRPRIPEEYPADPEHWAAMVLFSLAVTQLFLIFAPFDWLMRLSKNRRVATSLTVLFGGSVLAMKLQSLSTPLPTPLLAALLASRIVMGFLAVAFYLRGGVMLVWWWTFLFDARQLLDLAIRS